MTIDIPRRLRSQRSSRMDFVAPLPPVPTLPSPALHSTPVDAAPAPAYPVGGLTKRLFDITLGALALALALPVMLAIILLIWISDPGPVIFAQQRVGFRGRLFRCYKFRSMVIDADAALEQHLKSDPDAARQWQHSQKLANDPRVTWFGSILRKSSLDELPQLVNILKGDMSCVGPRPVLASELGRYGSAAADYIKARPGLTGLWQTSGRNRCTYDERVALDSDYVQHWSIACDLVIILRTVPVLLDGDKLR